MMKRAIAAFAALGLLLAGCTDSPADDEPTATTTTAQHEHAEPYTGEHPTGDESPRPGPDPTLTPDDTILDEERVAAGSGVFSLICNATHLGQFDPIVFPGEPLRGHMHFFCNNDELDENTVPGDLVGDVGNGSRPEDGTAYWAPTLLRGGAIPLQPERALVYYRAGMIRDLATIQAPPAGLVMIAGRSTATEAQNIEVVTWGCAGTSDGEAGGDKATIPDSCPPGSALRLKVRFPNCWDGVNLDSANHQDHMRYSWEDDGSKRACPSTHPVPIPEIETGFRWDVAGGDYSDLALSSGGEFSGHADFMNGWDQAALEALVTDCLHVRVNCGTIGVGGG